MAERPGGGAVAGQDRLALLGEVAHLYYEAGATQEAIAAQLRLSRPTVSRLLKEAREAGIVQIIVRRPVGRDPGLARALVQAYPGLEEAVVAAAGEGLDDTSLRRLLGQAAAAYLQGAVRDGDVVGVTWGHTMGDVAAALAPTPRRGVTVVQLNGGTSRASDDTNAALVVQRFGQAFAAAAHCLPAPAVVSTPAVAAALRADRHTAWLLDLARQSRVAVFSVGVPGAGSALVEAGYFTAADLNRLRHRGAVGDVCSRFFDAGGQPADPDLDARTVGVTLADLARVPCTVAVAGGPHKVAAIRGALAGRLVRVLITDSATARLLLAAAERGEAGP